MLRVYDSMTALVCVILKNEPKIEKEVGDNDCLGIRF